MPHDEASPPFHPSAGRGERAARVSAAVGGAVSEKNQRANTVVIGAGPAGSRRPTSSEARPQSGRARGRRVVGGISRTARVGDWRFDIGGHRFFTKVTPVRELWHEMLPDEDFLLRPRMSRIFYRGRFYDYPLRAFNALRNLGVLEAVRCVLSYLWVRIRPPKDLTTFEGYIASKFGWRLYGIFFKTYTEKVWGVPADQIQADWAAQRVKNLDLLRAIINSLAPRRNQKEITSLVEEFEYPRHGPGMMWERCHELVEGQGGEVHFHHAVSRIEHSDGLATAVIAETPAGEARFPCGDVVSSMPIPASCRRWTLLPRRRFSLPLTGWHSAISSRLRSSCPKRPASPTTGSTSTPRRRGRSRAELPELVASDGSGIRQDLPRSRIFRDRRRRTLDLER